MDFIMYEYCFEQDNYIDVYDDFIATEGFFDKGIDFIKRVFITIRDFIVGLFDKIINFFRRVFTNAPTADIVTTTDPQSIAIVYKVENNFKAYEEMCEQIEKLFDLLRAMNMSSLGVEDIAEAYDNIRDAFHSADRDFNVLPNLKEITVRYKYIRHISDKMSRIVNDKSIVKFKIADFVNNIPKVYIKQYESIMMTIQEYSKTVLGYIDSIKFVLANCFMIADEDSLFANGVYRQNIEDIKIFSSTILDTIALTINTSEKYRSKYGEYVIFINPYFFDKLPPNAKRFILAHEYGHTTLMRDKKDKFGTTNEEMQADYYAYIMLNRDFNLVKNIFKDIERFYMSLEGLATDKKAIVKISLAARLKNLEKAIRENNRRNN